MSEIYIEIVHRENGDVSLCHSDDHDNPLVNISFSPEVLAFLQGSEKDIAELMLRAGAQGYQQLQQEKLESSVAEKPALLH